MSFGGDWGQKKQGFGGLCGSVGTYGDSSATECDVAVHSVTFCLSLPFQPHTLQQLTCLQARPGQAGPTRACVRARACTVCCVGSRDRSSADRVLRRPRTGFCWRGKPIRFTEFHNHGRALGGQPDSWQRLDMLLVPGGPGKWLARSGRSIPSAQTPT